jgi:FixJ family two-component response regulator
MTSKPAPTGYRATPSWRDAHGTRRHQTVAPSWLSSYPEEIVRMQAQRSQVPSLQVSVPLPTVFIVDDDASARQSLERLMQSAGWTVESFDSADGLLARPRALQPGCLIVDTGGLELQEALADRPETPVIFVTSRNDVPMMVRAMKAGAVDFLTKPCSDSMLMSAVETAFDRSRRALAQEAALRSLNAHYTLLTPRERDVMGLVVRGLLNKQVAAELGISEVTVKTHRGRVMRKMAAGSLVSLANMARALGLD